MRRRSTPSISRRRRGIATVISVALATAAIGIIVPAASAQADLRVAVGVGTGTEAGNGYLSGDVTVAVGDSITFVIESDEPHTITSGQGPADVPPFAWPLTGFDGAAFEGPPPFDLGSASTDGTTFVNTGVLPVPGSSATVEFTAPGAVPIFCAIHPGMAMTVTVVEDGPVTTQEEADATAEANREALSAQFAPVREARLAEVSSTENDDGTLAWDMFADAATTPGPLEGGGSGYVELLEFLPQTIEIGVGDSVTWRASQFHTVTFLPDGMELREVYEGPEAAVAPAGGSVVDGSEVLNSGFFNVPGPDGQALTEYTLTFPEAGEYAYYCAIHAELGQLGSVIVS